MCSERAGHARTSSSTLRSTWPGKFELVDSYSRRIRPTKRSIYSWRLLIACEVRPPERSIKMSKLPQPRAQILLICIRSLLWALVVVSFMTFFFAVFIRPTAWYTQNTGGHFGKLQNGMKIPWHVLQKQVKNLDAPVVAGSFMAMVSAIVLARQCASTGGRCHMICSLTQCFHLPPLAAIRKTILKTA